MMRVNIRNGVVGFVLTLFILAASFAPQPVMAQDKAAMEKINAARIALITDRLSLTPDQAQKFWPLYNQYSLQRKELRLKLTDARRQIDPTKMTDQEGQRLMDLSLEIRQQEVNLEKEYAQRMRDVITAQQILSLRQAEDDFRRIVLQRIETLKRQQLNRDRLQQRQELQKRRDNN